MTSLSKTANQSAIDALFINNTTMDISASEVDTFLTNLLDSVLGGYGAISTVGASTLQELTTSFSKLTQFTANGVSANCTPDHTNDQITILVAGDYAFDIEITGFGEGAGTYTCAPSVGGTESTVYQDSHTTAGTEVFHLKRSGILTLAANDILTVEMKADATLDFTMTSGVFRVKRWS